jgi:hypothetical protein
LEWILFLLGGRQFAPSEVVIDELLFLGFGLMLWLFLFIDGLLALLLLDHSFNLLVVLEQLLFWGV